MELSWSTFLLEIINFLVLVWILKRFLYRPVLDVIARRRAGIDDKLAQAQQVQEDAETLKAKYEARMADWDRERQQARVKLEQELEQERSRQLEQLRRSLDKEREKARVADARRKTEAAREIEHQALQQSGEFATRLLSQAAGPELEARLLTLLLDNLKQLSPEQIAALQTTWGEPPQRMQITSAFPLNEQQRSQLEQGLRNVTELSLPVDYAEDRHLLAGLTITIGAWSLQVNLRGELKGFTEFAHASR